MEKYHFRGRVLYLLPRFISSKWAGAVESEWHRHNTGLGLERFSTPFNEVTTACQFERSIIVTGWTYLVSIEKDFRPWYTHVHIKAIFSCKERRSGGGYQTT